VELGTTRVSAVIVGEDEGGFVGAGLRVGPGVALGGEVGECEAVGIFSTVCDGLGEVVVLGDGSSRLPAVSPDDAGIDTIRDRTKSKIPAHTIPRAGHVREFSEVIISPYDPSVMALS
jgi:hypothetical protein